MPEAKSSRRDVVTERQLKPDEVLKNGGDARAQFALGSMYLTGNGVKQDRTLNRKPAHPGCPAPRSGETRSRNTGRPMRQPA